MTFGPSDRKEAEIFALEGLRADVQYEILKAIRAAGITQAELARRMGVKPAWVSQLLGDDANLTLESIAKIFTALNVDCRFAAPLLTRQRAAQPRVSASASPWTEGGALAAELRPRGEVAQFMRIVVTSHSERQTFMDAGNANGHFAGQRAAVA